MKTESRITPCAPRPAFLRGDFGKGIRLTHRSVRRFIKRAIRDERAIPEREIPKGPGRVILIMGSPEGHEFCVRWGSSDDPETVRADYYVHADEA